MQKLKAKAGKVRVDSCDILACDRRNGVVLVVGCTIGAPQIAEDGVKIKEVAVRLTRTLR